MIHTDMKFSFPFQVLLLCAAAFLLPAGCTTKNPSDFKARRERLFDNGWLFLRDSTEGAREPGFDDSGWRLIDLPHDWSIEDLQGGNDSTRIGPFSKSSPGKYSTGHVIGGTAWYRKHYSVETGDEGKFHFLNFEGVYMESDVWLNGHHLGYHPNGYTPFSYELTPYLNPPGEDNVIAVRVSNTGANSRWYSGSGIYRHVWLNVLDSLCISDRNCFTYTLGYGKDSAKILVNAGFINRGAAEARTSVVIEILNDGEYLVAEDHSETSLPGSGEGKISRTVTIPAYQLWTLEKPYEYRTRISLYAGDELKDRYSYKFGIRTCTVSAEEGLKLNGKKVLMKGTCMHHDNGLLGAAAFNRSEFRRVEIMKANGFNAIRTSHNPPSRAFLDACDNLGMLVIDEAFDAWTVPKKPMDYSRFFPEWHERDLRSMIERDRNHPSVIIWSIGNEIPERADTAGIRIARELIGIIRELDTTRPVTNAICEFWDHPGREWDRTAPAFAVLDIGGYNYKWKQYAADHRKYPGRIMMGTESVPREAKENWEAVENDPWVIGDFVWTGMDYLGEAGIGHTVYLDEGEESGFSMPWPWYISWCGDIDICGNKKVQSYYRDVVWKRSMIEMAVQPPVPEGKHEVTSYWGWPDEYRSWNWPGKEGKDMKVRVYTRYPAVRVELNGKVAGDQSASLENGMSTGTDSLRVFEFEVPYEAGMLTAIAHSGGKDIESRTLRTSGPARTIHLSADRGEIWASRKEVAYVNVQIQDAQGRLVPDAASPITLTVTGAGMLIGAGNADPTGMESLQDSTFTTFRGRALVIVRSDGSQGWIEIEATSPGLDKGIADIRAL